jgi:hypothetical protein
MLFAFFLSLVCLTAIHDTDRGCAAFKSSVDAKTLAFMAFISREPGIRRQIA